MRVQILKIGKYISENDKYPEKIMLLNKAIS